MSLLDNVRIARPCPVAWERMKRVGDGDAVRFCDLCKKNVYDLASMTRQEAEALVAQAEPPCVQVFRRQDGKVMTSDCGAPRAATRRPGRRGRVTRDDLVMLGGIPVTTPPPRSRSFDFELPRMLGRLDLTPRPQEDKPDGAAPYTDRGRDEVEKAQDRRRKRRDRSIYDQGEDRT